jgi:hypothetical protein
MLPLQLNKTRAAAARNLYGLAPEQLLAYASYMPRLPAGYAPPAPSGHPHHHHGALLAAAAAAGYPSVTAPNEQGGMPQGLDLLRSSTGGGHPHQQQQMAANNGGGGAAAAFNPRDLAAVQMFAQHQAVHDALVGKNSH